MKIIKFKTCFSSKNSPTIVKKAKNKTWDGVGYPNNFYIDHNYMPKKTSQIEIGGKNFISDDDNFLNKNNIFRSLKYELKNYKINIQNDDYLKLREKKQHFADMYISYQDDDFGYFEEDPYLINFDIMLQTSEFEKMYKHINDTNDKFNFEITLNFNENEIFPEKKKEGVESARYDVIDFKLIHLN